MRKVVLNKTNVISNIHIRIPAGQGQYAYKKLQPVCLPELPVLVVRPLFLRSML